MSSASQARFKDEARMDKATFLLLLQRLTSPIGQLRTSRVISPGRQFLMLHVSTVDTCVHTVTVLFNLRHSSLRNIVERAWGIVKRRFPVLAKMASFSFEFQCKLVMCALMLHNFIRRNQAAEDMFDQPTNNEEEDDDSPRHHKRASCCYAGQHRTADVD
eukprot:gene1521-1658_t